MRCLVASKILKEELELKSKSQKEELGLPEIDDTENGKWKTLYEEENECRVFLLPSFLKLIVYLKKNKRNFSIIFRTFGDDAENIKIEFNNFCDGLHPCYSGKNKTPLFKLNGQKSRD